MPIGGEEWIYEMTVNCMLGPRSEGIPTWQSEQVGERMMMKLPEQFKGIFAQARPLDEEIGRQLALWANGGTVAKFEDKVLDAGRAIAKNGMDALRNWWGTLAEADRTRLKPTLENELKATAAIADTAREQRFSDFDTSGEHDGAPAGAQSRGEAAVSPVAASPSTNPPQGPGQPRAADEAASDGAPARTQPTPETAEAAELPTWPAGQVPGTEAEYARFARAWFAKVRDGRISLADARLQWKADMKLRNGCHVGEEVRDALKAELDALLLEPVKG